MGVIQLDARFNVSHTKDAVLYAANEEEELEDYLFELTKNYREFASKRRGERDPIKREKFKEMVSDLKSEFVNDELRDVINTSVLPPLEMIIANNAKQAESVTDEEKVGSWQITTELRVDIWIQDKSENDPYVVRYAGADKGVIHIIVNRIHPYYAARPTVEAIYECIRQYIYDAVAEYRVAQLIKLTPDSVRRMKDALLRADASRIENLDAPAAADDANGKAASAMPSLHRARHRYFGPLTSASMKEARSEWSRLPKTRFLMDANMEPWALHVLRYKRWDVRPCDFANLRRSDDQAVFAAAWRLKRLLITHDSDFLDDRLFPFANCSGLLVLPTYDSVSMQYANLLAGACELVSKGARLWFHTKIVARRDFTVRVRNWEKSHGHIAEWQYRIAPGYRNAASENS